MTKEYWQEVEKVARERREVLRLRLDALETERAEALQEMAQVEQLLHSVAPFTSDRPLEALKKIVNDFVIDADSGLANACRAVLRATNRYMSASNVRDALEASAYDLTQHSNPLASIHSILKRFEDSGEVSMAAIGNKAAYRIAPEKRSPAWRKHLTATGVSLSDPPYGTQKKALTVREATEAKQAQEAVEQAEVRKRRRELESRKKS